MAYGYWLEAEYESGFILREDSQDRSPYRAGDNFFSAIRRDSATQSGHGPLVRFSLIPWDASGRRHEIDWTALAELEHVRPVYFRRMSQTTRADGTGDAAPVCNAHGFGYQYLDANGDNIQVITELT